MTDERTIDRAPRGDDETPTKRGRMPLLIGGGVVALAAIGYLGAAAHYSDTIAKGTTIAGQNVGGMTKSQAKKALAKVAGGDTSKAATVTAGGHSFEVKPGAAQSLEADKALDGVTGFSLSPVSLWKHVTGSGDDVPGSYRFDDTKLRSLIKEAAAEKIPDAPKQATVKFIGGKVYSVDGKPGQGVDEAAVAKEIEQGWPKQSTYTTKLVDRTSDERVAAVAAFAQGDAAKAMSAPLVVKAKGEQLTIQPKDVSDFISTTFDDDKPRIAVDSAAFLEFVLSRTTNMTDGGAVDAKVVWTDGKPSVRPGHDGTRIDPSKIEQTVRAALVGNHEADLPLMTEKPHVSKNQIDVASLPTTSMAHFRSVLPGGPSNAARTHNITNAVNWINGTVVLPGQQFSLLRTLGYDLSKKKGYVEAGTLQNGLHVDGMGGGVSQVSTVVYNTAFFAGVQLDKHTSHAVYIDRYPVGREATLWNPGVDNTWTNDTGKPILIKAHVTGSAVEMDFYGSRQYDVTTRTGPRQHVVQPKVRHVKNVKGCENTVGSGTPGFSIDVWRTLAKDGKKVREERIHTTYQADDIIRCG